MDNEKKCCITVVGDGTVGKTCLLMNYIHGVVPDSQVYIPTVFENYQETVKIDGVDYDVQYWDTAGQEEYDRLRVLCYPKTTVFLVCYDVKSKASFQNCEVKWVPEIRKYNKCPIVLIGTKSDRLKDAAEEKFAKQEGDKLAKQIKAKGFFLTSAARSSGVKPAIEWATKLGSQKPKNESCKLF